MTKVISLQTVSNELAERLEAESRSRGESVEDVVMSILEAALDGSPRRRDLSRFVDWSEEEAERVNRAVAEQRTIDESLWH